GGIERHAADALRIQVRLHLQDGTAFVDVDPLIAGGQGRLVEADIDDVASHGEHTSDARVPICYLHSVSVLFLVKGIGCAEDDSSGNRRAARNLRPAGDAAVAEVMTAVPPREPVAAG